MIHLGDITKIDGSKILPVDVIIGGSPCQELSIAGKREGLSGERSGLFMEQIRIIKEMHKEYGTAYPRFMVWENVPGALSSNEGEDFRIVLEEIAKIAEPDTVIPRPPKGKWRNSGCIVGDRWSIAWRILDAQFWGVPQRRRRIALVADFGGQSAPEILFERKGVPGDFEESGTQKEATSRSFEESSYKAIYDARGNGDGTTSPTLTGDHQNRITDYTAVCVQKNLFSQQRHDEYNEYIVRRLTPLECERLQGFLDGWTDIGDYTDSSGKKKQSSDTTRYKALGNSIALPPWRWVIKRLCNQYNKSATMGSLFDGIGGFPLIWEEINGKGSCLWASEIEEFPIAVTKRRFSK